MHVKLVDRPAQVIATCTAYLHDPYLLGALHYGLGTNACLQLRCLQGAMVASSFSGWHPHVFTVLGLSIMLCYAALQSVVEKMLAKEGITRASMGREAFTEKARPQSWPSHT
jgi:hypothetical protein